MVQICITQRLFSAVLELETVPTFPVGFVLRAQRLIDIMAIMETFRCQNSQNMVLLYNNRDEEQLNLILSPLKPDGIENTRHMREVLRFPTQVEKLILNRMGIDLKNTTVPPPGFSSNLAYAALSLGIRVAKTLREDGYVRGYSQRPNCKSFVLQHEDLWKEKLSSFA